MDISMDMVQWKAKEIIGKAVEEFRDVFLIDNQELREVLIVLANDLEKQEASGIYKCLACGRDKFQRPFQPHKCNGQYRKHNFPAGFSNV